MRIELLVRPRLLRSLQAALRSGHVLISAPAGYGKTVLLRSLAIHQPHTYYLPLTPADADLPHLRERLRAVPPAARWQPQTTLLLDDVHHLEGGVETQDWLVEQLRRTVPHLVLAGREAPSPTVHDLVTKGQLAHLDSEDLAFTLEESRVFLEQHAPYAPDRVTAWHQHTGGWPLALALLARVHAAPDPFPAAKTELFAYLARTLAQTLPPALLHFWTITAIPLHFNDELAADLLGPGGDAVALRQEIQHRNLFLEPAEMPGWFRYHKLIREFLLQAAGTDLTALFHRAVAWFKNRDDLEMAIEHALAGQLQDEAARLLLQVPHHFVRDSGRYRTFHRWVLSLNEATRAAHPALLLRLGREIHEIGWREEAWTYLQEGLRLAEAGADPLLRLEARFCVARAHHIEGNYEAALSLGRQILNDKACTEVMRLQVLSTTAIALIRSARFQEARRIYDEATTLAQRLDDETALRRMRHNLATYVLIPLGAFEQGRAALKANERGGCFDERPNALETHLWGWCEYSRATADWDRLARLLEEVAALREQTEVKEATGEFWYQWFSSMMAVGRGRLSEARSALAEAKAFASDHPERLVCLAWARGWLWRRQGRPSKAVAVAEETLAQSLDSPFYRALLALEHDLAQGTLWLEGNLDRFSLHPETKRLIQWRARGELVRLRALLALCSRRMGDWRWQRHLHAALCALRRPGYERLLIQGDPDLGGRFWALALAEDVAAEQAEAALRQIGNPAIVLPLLKDSDAAVRRRAAQALATIGCEEAMPALAAALAAERDKPTRAELKAALVHLESCPPPSLKVKLLGDFALWRDEQPVPDDAWQRPVVRRLFQYFALHQGIPLSRDRILDDLWPQSDPQKAWVTFRTVYSRLRHVLEPYMRPKSPCRYVAVEGGAYCFDPQGVVHVDAEAFEAVVRRTLSTVEGRDMPLLPEDLLTALEKWEPLLPELSYEEWLLERRERLQGLYIEGCLYVAQSLLIHGRPGEAIAWARRALQAAPWLEEGYQALMRAYARQGQRSLALKVYVDAANTLRRELDIAPSPLTQWLAKRLQRGEEI